MLPRRDIIDILSFPLFFPFFPFFFSRLVPRRRGLFEGTGRGARGRTRMEEKAGIAEACVSGAHLLPA